MNPDQQENWLFWGTVLSTVLFKPVDDDRSDRQILLQISRQSFSTPKGQRRSYSYSTLKRKLKAYRKLGIEGLGPAQRSDEGSIRKDRDDVLKRAIEIKLEAPARSHSKINLILRSEGLEPIPASTLLRHLNQHGATLRKLGYCGEIVRKRWTCPYTHDMWVGDYSQGPTILDEEGNAQKTWISAFIDVHSRFLVVGIYAFTCDMDALVNSLLAAFEQHGKPRALYLDNAKVYRSPVLARACLDLGIDLIHRTVRDPQGGGIIERFFLTAQNHFEVEFCTHGKTLLTLSRLNELFTMYVDEVYHRSVHSETKQTPRQRYSSGLLGPIKPVRKDSARKAFVQQWSRKVDSDFCDVSINNIQYACDIKLRGDKILLRAPVGQTPETLEVYELSGKKKLGEATRHDRSNRRIPDPQPVPEDTTDYGEVLEKIRDQNRQQESASPKPPSRHIDHSTPEQSGSWTLENFVTRVCGQAEVEPTTLDDHELQLLSLVYGRSRHWTVAKLTNTWKRCETKSLQQFLIELSQSSITELP